MFGDSITARLGLDTTGFKAGLSGVNAAASRFKSTMAGLGVTIGIAGITQAISSVIQYGDKIQDLSDRFNVNAEALQRLGNVAELNGSSLESMAQGFNKLAISISRALGGNEKVMDSFVALGISVADLKKLSPEEIMLKLGKSSMNAADMVNLLGRNALELRPTLEGIADGTIKMGEAIDSIKIKRLSDADDLFKKIGQSIKLATAEAVAFGLKMGDSLEKYISRFGGKLGMPGYDAPAAGATAEADALPKRSREKERRDEQPPLRSSAELRAEQKERERLQFSLKELADRNAQFGNDQSIQAWWAGQEARNVQDTEARARQMAINDPAGAKLELDRADEKRRSISGLKESERGVDLIPILTSSNQHLQTIATEMVADD